MKRVTIFRNAIDATDRTTADVDDVCRYLSDQFGNWPDTAKIYHNSVDAMHDITPSSKAGIEHLQKLEGHFYVVVWPQDPITIAVVVAIAIAAVAIGLAFLLRPSVPHQYESSPNNDLSDRQNKARPNERIPDIVGTVRSTLDLLNVPYKTFTNNKEFEYCYFCVGRGYYDIIDCKDDSTPVDQIEGEWVGVYPPFNSPNSATPTIQKEFGLRPAIVPKVLSVQHSNAINGQAVRAPNSGQFESHDNVAFQYGGVILTNDSQVDFTEYFIASTVQNPAYITIFANDDNINASDPAEHIHSVSLAGTYQILSVSTNQIVLSNPAAINANWNILSGFAGQTSTYHHTFRMTASGNQQIGPYILNINNLTEVWANFVAQNGLYYIDSSGNQHAMTVTIQMTVQSIDETFAPIGVAITGSINITGSGIDRILCGSTLKVKVPTPGPVQVTVQRITPLGTDRNLQYSQDIQWRDLYAVSAVSATDFGDVTTAMAITAQTPDALTVKERKLNMLVTRMLPTWINRSAGGDPQFSSTLYATNNAADIFCALALDPVVGRRQLSELDVAGIYAVADSAYLGGEHVNGELVQYFGTFLMTECCYTFDDSKTTFEEMAAYIAQAINCIAFRSARTISLFFEKKTADSTIIYNHRNKLPKSEKRTISFGTINDNDSVTYDFVDPNAPNYPDVDSPRTLYYPVNQSGKTPKQIKGVGVRNIVQATLNGWRLFSKIIGANIQTEFDATQEANLNIINERVLVADNTRTGTQDGEIYGVDGLTITTSQPSIMPGATPYIDTSLDWTVPTAHIIMFRSRPLEQNGWKATFTEFPAPVLPVDAVIQGIYPVIIGSAVKDQASAIYGFSIIGAISESNFTLPSNPSNTSFSNSEFYAASIGTVLSALDNMQISADMQDSLFQDGLTDSITLTGIAFAIFYTSATPSTDTRMPSPFAVPSGQGMALSLPRSVAVGTSGFGGSMLPSSSGNSIGGGTGSSTAAASIYDGPPANYTIFLQHYDKTVEALGAYPTSDPYQLILQGPPLLPLVSEPSKWARTTYILVPSNQTAPSLPFLITKKEPQDNNTYKMSAINYSDSYYSHDLDFINGVVLAPVIGYGPQGYTGSGNTKADGTTATGGGSGYTGDGGLGGTNNPQPPVTTGPSGGTGGAEGTNPADNEILIVTSGPTIPLLAHTPSPLSSLKVCWQGNRQRYLTDYTVDGRQITAVTFVPSVGDNLIADYRY